MRASCPARAALRGKQQRGNRSRGIFTGAANEFGDEKFANTNKLAILEQPTGKGNLGP
jgi:hypothetical protein